MKRPVAAGTILAGKYRLISLVGRGGMGAVWRAERMGWQAPVAIKLMNAVDVHDTPALARFQREARLAASLRSVHVVQVLDDGVDPATGAPFIVMELLEGETLAERLMRVKRLRPPVVAQVISQIARALAKAHEAGLIHRDLKPDNILVTRNEDEELVKVLDFGIAKWLGGHQSSGTLAGQMLGTPAYMSPEHFANSANIDHRADLWGLGVIAFECLTGTRPFQGETLVSLALSVCNGRYEPASSFANVPDGFDAWFARAVARDPNDRFPSARVMADELRGLSGHIPMLWEDAVLPAQHATREQTELEPVLELTRRAKGSRTPEAKVPITQIDSVLPMLRSHGAPTHRGNGLRWAVALASLMLFVSMTVVAAPVLRPAAVENVVARVRAMAAHFERPAQPIAPAAPAAGVPLPAPPEPPAAMPATPVTPVDAGAPRDAAPNAGGAPHGKRAPCQSDQACNDDPSVSALWGRCTELGVCECNEGFERSPVSDLCRPRRAE
jgi:serine/threonine protein kinase